MARYLFILTYHGGLTVQEEVKCSPLMLERLLNELNSEIKKNSLNETSYHEKLKSHFSLYSPVSGKFLTSYRLYECTHSSTI